MSNTPNQSAVSPHETELLTKGLFALTNAHRTSQKTRKLQAASDEWKTEPRAHRTRGDRESSGGVGQWKSYAFSVRRAHKEHAGCDWSLATR